MIIDLLQIWFMVMSISLVVAVSVLGFFTLLEKIGDKLC